MCSHTQEPDDGNENTCAVPARDELAIAAARAEASSAGRVRRTTQVFSALADPTRLRLLEALLGRELCVCDLAAVAEVSQSAVSHQLRLLRDRGLVTYRREGNRALYSLADDHVRDLIGIGFEHADEEAGT